MDRFIEVLKTQISHRGVNLKSNMDRFIDFVFDELGNNFSLFKIQYG